MKTDILKRLSFIFAMMIIIASFSGCDKGTETKKETSRVSSDTVTVDNDYATSDATAEANLVITGNSMVDTVLAERFLGTYDTVQDTFFILDEKYYEYTEKDNGYSVSIKKFDFEKPEDKTLLAVIPAEYNGKPIIEYQGTESSMDYVNVAVLPDTDYVMLLKQAANTWNVYCAGQVLDYGVAYRCAAKNCLPRFDAHGLVINNNQLVVVHADAVDMSDDGETIIVPEGIEEICEYAFTYCNDFSEVQLPSTLKRIDEAAFKDTGLRSITFPSGLESIGVSAFEGTQFMECDVVLPNSLTSLGGSAFASSGIHSVKFGTGLTILDGDVFKITNLNGTIVIPGNIKTIKRNAVVSSGVYDESLGIQEIILEEGVEDVEDEAFCNNAKLTSLVLPDSLNKFYASSISYCPALTEVVIPDNTQVFVTGCQSNEFAENFVFKYRGKEYTTEDFKELEKVSWQ